MTLWTALGELTHVGDTSKRIAAGTTSINHKIAGAAPTGHIATKDDKILVNDGTTDRIIIGRRADNTYGVSVAKSGSDVKTATAGQMIMNSDFNMFKIVASGTSSITVPLGTTGTYGANNTIAHGLGYVPVVIGFVETFRDDQVVGTFWSPVPYSPQTTDGIEFSILADATNIYPLMIVDNGAGWAGETINYRYYIMVETAT